MHEVPTNNNNNKKKPPPVVKFNSISTAKDYFSVSNERHQKDFTMAYNPNRKKRITVSTMLLAEQKIDNDNDKEPTDVADESVVVVEDTVEGEEGSITNQLLVVIN